MLSNNGEIVKEFDLIENSNKSEYELEIIDDIDNKGISDLLVIFVDESNSFNICDNILFCSDKHKCRYFSFMYILMIEDKMFI